MANLLNCNSTRQRAFTQNKQNLTHGMYEELRSLQGDSPKAGKLLKEIKSVSDKNVAILDGIQEAVPNF